MRRIVLSSSPPFHCWVLLIPVSLLRLVLSVAGLMPVLTLVLALLVIPVSLLVDSYFSLFGLFYTVLDTFLPTYGDYIGVGTPF